MGMAPSPCRSQRRSIVDNIAATPQSSRMKMEPCADDTRCPGRELLGRPRFPLRPRLVLDGGTNWNEITAKVQAMPRKVQRLLTINPIGDVPRRSKCLWCVTPERMRKPRLQRKRPCAFQPSRNRLLSNARRLWSLRHEHSCAHDESCAATDNSPLHRHTTDRSSSRCRQNGGGPSSCPEPTSQTNDSNRAILQRDPGPPNQQ